MPTELRNIIFDLSELQEAVEAFSRKGNAHALPAGQFRLIEVGGDQDVYATAQIPGPSPGTVGEHRLDAVYLMAALLVYCRALRIPIPRAFDKSLRCSNGKLVFELRSAGRSKAGPARVAALSAAHS